MDRKVTWGEVTAAAILFAVIVLAEGRGQAAQLSSLLLHGLGAALFLLFAAWMARAVYLSVQGAPDYSRREPLP